METMKPLNTTDGRENIVNHNAMHRASTRERIANKKRERRLRKMLAATCFMAIICIVFVILGFAGAVAGWLTTVPIVASLVSSSFLCGRYVEMKKV